MKWNVNWLGITIIVLLLQCTVVLSEELLQNDQELRNELSQQISNIATLKRQGKSRGQIARWVVQAVDGRIVALNRTGRDEGQKGIISASTLSKKKLFDEWSDIAIEVDDSWASAHWAWKHRVGHCNEHSFTAYFLLMEGLKQAGVADPGQELAVYAGGGDHAYVIWGAPPGSPSNLTEDDFLKWKDAWIIDPWVGITGSGKKILKDLKVLKKQANEKGWNKAECGSFIVDANKEWGRWFPTYAKFQDMSYKMFKKQYDLWLNDCKSLAGLWGDKLSAVSVIQKNCSVGVVTSDLEASGLVRGRQAILNRIYKGQASSVSLGLRDFVSGGIDQLRLGITKQGSAKPTIRTLVRQKWPKVVLDLSAKHLEWKGRHGQNIPAGHIVYPEFIETKICKRDFNAPVVKLNLKLNIDLQKGTFTGSVRGKVYKEIKASTPVYFNASFESTSSFSGKVEPSFDAVFINKAHPVWKLEGKVPVKITMSMKTECQDKDKKTGRFKNEPVENAITASTNAKIRGTFHMSGYDPSDKAEFEGSFEILGGFGKSYLVAGTGETVHTAEVVVGAISHTFKFPAKVVKQ